VFLGFQTGGDFLRAFPVYGHGDQVYTVIHRPETAMGIVVDAILALCWRGPLRCALGVLWRVRTLDKRLDLVESGGRIAICLEEDTGDTQRPEPAFALQRFGVGSLRHTLLLAAQDGKNKRLARGGHGPYTSEPSGLSVSAS
jgi:hypothetical protein